MIAGVMGAAPYTSMSPLRLRAFTAGTPVVTGGPMVVPTQNETTYVTAMILGLIVWVLLLAGGIVFIVSGASGCSASTRWHGRRPWCKQPPA